MEEADEPLPEAAAVVPAAPPAGAGLPALVLPARRGAGEKLATATATVDDTVLTATKTFTIPALDPADDPDTPDTPDEPVTPDEPTGDNLCPWDHVDHGDSFFGRLIRFFHSILFFISSLFGSSIC